MAGLALHELHALTAVASLRSFRGAAAELGVSPSALSHAVASVERRLGVRLFNRSTRSVSLTEAGAAFLARVQPALREMLLEGLDPVALTLKQAPRIEAFQAADRLQRVPPFDAQGVLVVNRRVGRIDVGGDDFGDIREGGVWRFDMVGTFEGKPQRFPNLMGFLEIVPNERIVFDHGSDVDDDRGYVAAPVAEVRRVFTDADDRVIYLGEVTYRGDFIHLEMDLTP